MGLAHILSEHFLESMNFSGCCQDLEVAGKDTSRCGMAPLRSFHTLGGVVIPYMQTDPDTKESQCATPLVPQQPWQVVYPN